MMSNPEPVVEIPLKRFDTLSHQSDRYYGFWIRNGDPIELDENNEDSITYIDEMQRSDSDKWIKVMISKMESMKVNDVWILVDPSEGVKPIRCKWVFKRKRDAYEKIEIYKVCLIVKSYH